MSKKSTLVIVAIVMVLAGLMLVTTELAYSDDKDLLSDSRNIAIAEVLTAMRTNDTEMRNARIANAEIWLKGHANEELTPAEEEIYAQLVYMKNEQAWAISEHNKLVPRHRPPGRDDYTGLENQCGVRAGGNRATRRK